MLRAAAIALLTFCMLVTMLPLTSVEASWGNRSVSTHGKGHKVKRHSRAWWRRYRARMKRKRLARLNRQRLLAQRRLQPEQFANGNPTDRNRVAPNPGSAPAGTSRGTWSVAMPSGWSNQPQMVNGELSFRVSAEGRSGSATLSVVGAAAPQAEANAFGRMKRESLAGVSTSIAGSPTDQALRKNSSNLQSTQFPMGPTPIRFA